jgi:HD superfamily phosphohydrolase YqeK
MYNEIRASEAMYPTQQHDWPVVELAVQHVTELRTDDNNQTAKVAVCALAHRTCKFLDDMKVLEFYQ